MFRGLELIRAPLQYYTQDVLEAIIFAAKKCQGARAVEFEGSCEVVELRVLGAYGLKRTSHDLATGKGEVRGAAVVIGRSTLRVSVKLPRFRSTSSPCFGMRNLAAEKKSSLPRRGARGPSR